jgi:CoA:oxalate CoA-transferase
VATFDDEQWHALLNVLELAGLADDPRFASLELRWQNRAALDEAISSVTPRHNAGELASTLQRVGVAAAPVRTAEDLLADEQLVADDFLGEVTHTELGPALLPKMPWRIAVDGVGERPIGPAPDFGHDTRDILQSILGVTDEGWEALVGGGIVA